MPTRTNEPDNRQTIGSPNPDAYDRYSHVNTETGEIIYDTERDNAWIQAACSVRLDEWR